MREGLRDYLLKGGFLWVDDYWGPYAWEDFAREIAKVLPPGQYPIKDLTPDHPIYRALFEVAVDSAGAGVAVLERDAAATPPRWARCRRARTWPRSATRTGA